MCQCIKYYKSEFYQHVTVNKPNTVNIGHTSVSLLYFCAAIVDAHQRKVNELFYHAPVSQWINVCVHVCETNHV